MDRMGLRTLETPSTWEKTHRQKGVGRNGHRMAVTSDTAGFSMVEGDAGVRLRCHPILEVPSVTL